MKCSEDVESFAQRGWKKGQFIHKTPAPSTRSSLPRGWKNYWGPTPGAGSPLQESGQSLHVAVQGACPLK